MAAQPKRPSPRGRIAIGLVGLVVAAVALFYALDGFARSDRLSIRTRTGSRDFSIEWAMTPDERAKGLMFRQEMAADHGMLFDFGREQPVTFWMKNTPLSLDMVFIHADGTVYRVARDVEPMSERLTPAGAPVRYVLEVVAGTAARIGLDSGDHVSIPSPPKR